MIPVKLKKIFPEEDISKYNYSPVLGIYPSTTNLYTEFIHETAKIFFQILEKYEINYALFAGSSVGMVRNKENIPWVDDFDVIIMEEDFEKFKNIQPILKLNNFTFQKKICTWFTFHHQNRPGKNFRCDIFPSKTRNKILENITYCGIYHNAKIPIEFVLPFKKQNFHNDLNVYFFNDYEKEVQLTYGDVLKDVRVYSHSTKITNYNNWEIAYKDFNFIKEKAIENTKSKIYNENYEPLNFLTIEKNYFENELELLKYINNNNIKKINIFDIYFLKCFSTSINYYFPQVEINFYCQEINKTISQYLNYCNTFYVSNQNILNHYDDCKIFYNKKPKIKLTKLITFGTFDLFHIGHKNLFERCKKYSENIIVGLSTDQFTYNKKKIYPAENYEIRKNNLLKYVQEVFPEEKMELKNEYIQQNDADLLIMGDDWKGQFDWVDCPVIYLPRTENISSTMLRKKKLL